MSFKILYTSTTSALSRLYSNVRLNLSVQDIIFNEGLDGGGGEGGGGRGSGIL